METLWQDVRYGFRTLRRAPVFSFMALLVVMLGIGASTAIFSVIDAVLLEQLPFKDPHQLVAISLRHKETDAFPFNLADFAEFQSESRLLSGLAAFEFRPANVTGEGEPERLQQIRTSANFFQVMGTPALLGRTLLPDDDRPSSPHIVVVSYGLWRRRFGGDPAVIGKTLELNGESYSVVGVLPAKFFFPVRAAELAVPIQPENDPRLKNRGDHFLNLVGRLQPGVSMTQATTELDAICNRLRQQYPTSNGKDQGVMLRTLSDRIVGSFRGGLLALLGAVGVLLLIACSSLANLLLARSSSRRRELALRSALGATQQRIVRQLVTEATILSLLGGLCGIFLAAVGIRALVALGPSDLPRAQEIAVNARVLWAAVGLSLLSGFVFAVIPALRFAKANFDHLRAAGVAAADGGGGRLRAFIVGAQVALSLVLLVGAGLLLKSFSRLQAVQPGFDPANVLTLRLSLPAADFPDVQTVANFYSGLQDRVNTIPGVKSSAAVSILPFSGPLANVDFTVVGKPPASPDQKPTADFRATGRDYFQTMHIPLIAGRTFAQGDNADTNKVIVVSHNLAQQFFGSDQVIGEHLDVEQSGSLEIVGVVGDVKDGSLDETPGPTIYVPYAQLPPFALVYMRNNMFLVVRTAANPLGVASAVRQELRSLQRNVPISRIAPMGDYVAATVAPRRFSLLLIGLFGLTALLMAILGIYALVAYSVTLRMHEFGVRIALGAQRRDVVGSVMAQGGRTILVASAIGVLGSIAVSRLMANFLYQVQPTDLATYAGVVALIVGAALFASFVPAMRAAGADPMSALRND